jgi:hypothetical protein
MTRRHDEGEEKIGDDEPHQNPRIGGSDPQHHHVGEPARDAGARRDHAEQQRREQEPGGVVGETGEGDGKAHDAKRPEQEAADQPGDGVVHRPGDPSDHHEHGDGEPVLGSGLDVERHEPNRNRHDDAQRLAQKRDIALRGGVLRQRRCGCAVVESHAFPVRLESCALVSCRRLGPAHGPADASTGRVVAAASGAVKARITERPWRAGVPCGAEQGIRTGRSRNAGAGSRRSSSSRSDRHSRRAAGRTANPRSGRRRARSAPARYR